MSFRSLFGKCEFKEKWKYMLESLVQAEESELPQGYNLQLFLCKMKWIFNTWEEVSQGTGGILEFRLTPSSLQARVLGYIWFSTELLGQLFPTRGVKTVMLISWQWGYKQLWGEACVSFSILEPVGFGQLLSTFCTFLISYSSPHFSSLLISGYLPTLTVLAYNIIIFFFMFK